MDLDAGFYSPDREKNPDPSSSFFSSSVIIVGGPQRSLITMLELGDTLQSNGHVTTSISGGCHSALKVTPVLALEVPS